MKQHDLSNVIQDLFTRSMSQGGQHGCHLTMHDLRKIPTKYENCTLYRSKDTHKVSLLTDIQKNRQTDRPKVV